MLELIVYPKTTNPRLINASPFCVKAQTFLRLAKVEYRITEFNGDPKKFPKGKLPVLVHGEKMVPDSYFIQRYVEEKLGVNLDAHLTPAERAQGFAFAKMCEEFLYWAIVHERWFIEENWLRLRDEYFANIPKLLRGLITGLIRKDALKAAKGHGMSLHSDQEIFALGKECLRSIADFLAQKPFLLGERPSSYDASIFSFVSSVLHSDLGAELKAEAKRHSNLMAYDDRMFRLAGFEAR
jgi:glutathione S-transferase